MNRVITSKWRLRAGSNLPAGCRMACRIRRCPPGYGMGRKAQQCVALTLEFLQNFEVSHCSESFVAPRL